MKRSYLSSIWWIVKLQFSTSKIFFAWKFIYSIYDGASTVVSTYLGAKFLTSVTAVAFQHTASHEVYRWLVLLLAAELIGVVLQNVNQITERRFQQKIEIAINEMFIVKMYSLSQEQFADEEFNTKLSRASESIGSLENLLSELSWFVSSMVRFASAIGAIIIVAPLIGTIIVLTIFPVTLIRMKRNKLQDDTYKKIEPFDRVAYRSRWMLIDPQTMPEIRLMSAFKHVLASWRKNMQKSHSMWFETDKKVTWIDTGVEVVEPAVNFLANVYFFRLLALGSLGLDRFIFLRGLLEQASSSATAVGGSFEKLHELSINLRNFKVVYDTLPAITNGEVKVRRPLTIEFKNVCFSYPGSNQPSLEDISFVVHPGSKLALVGENGAGKSTLLRLLLRQYLPDSGSILINGTNIKDVNQESYYAALSNLSQDFLTLTHLTIKENLLMGLERDISDKEIMSAIEMVGADEFISKLPHKLNQRLDPSFKDGTGLSGGQIQRLGVARAILRSGDLMILDEPTSAIDAKAEYSIFNNIYQAHAGKTTLIVSHRFSTVRKADKIIVMEKGRITEYGSHEELLKYGGLYKEMFEAQAEGYK